jgi:hypothetical protein
MNSGTQKFNMVATLFKSHPRAERAVKLLQKAAFDRWTQRSHRSWRNRLLRIGHSGRSGALNGTVSDFCSSDLPIRF